MHPLLQIVLGGAAGYVGVKLMMSKKNREEAVLGEGLLLAEVAANPRYKRRTRRPGRRAR